MQLTGALLNPSSKKIKKKNLKKFLIFQEMELSSPKLKKLLTFQEGNCNLLISSPQVKKFMISNISPELLIKLVASNLSMGQRPILRIFANPREILCFPW